MPPEPPPRVYAKQLLPFGYGYPLWTPEPGIQFLRYRRDGLRIGDVGVIVPENGSFDVFFNIYLPREHPFHRVNGVPDNFTHIELNDTDIAIYSPAENPGRIISTSSVTTLRTVEPSGDSHQNALSYEFNLSCNEGALLILPDGAESYALRKKKCFMDAAIKHGVDWYNFAEQQLGRIITHDSLYLITGCYKAQSWSVAAFHELSSQTGPTEFPAQFKAIQAQQDNLRSAYTWEAMRALHWRVGPLGDWTEMSNQAVFVSGFKIAMRDGILGGKRVQVQVDASPASSFLKPGKIFSGGKGHSRARDTWRRLISRRGGNTETEVQADAVGIPMLDSVGATERVTVSHVPETLKNFHPSNFVNQYLLNKEPSAIVAVTHDSHWTTLLEKGALKLEDFGCDGCLESLISEHYGLVSRDGAVYLQSKTDSSLRLSNIDDAAREAWKENRLDDAEEILTMKIIRHRGCDYFGYAHRALIRARLHQWDAALRDAEMSIDIQPSVTAHVARGFALFGQKNYTSAVNAFNVALRDCVARDKALVSIVKTVALFEVGYHAESIADIVILTERCSVDVKSACLAVQAEMYAKLAALETVKGDYDRALQLLARIAVPNPLRLVPELDIIFLMFGWRFHVLNFTMSKQKCEILHLAGRTLEAIELLRTMTRELGEDIRTRKDDARWVSEFTQRCIRTLASLGDEASASHNYAEAITHYSTALDMDSTIQEDILLKRSKVFATLGSWNDSLNDANNVISANPLSALGHERRLVALQGMGRLDEAIQAHTNMLDSLEKLADLQEPERVVHGNDPGFQTLHQPFSIRYPNGSSIVERAMKAMQDKDSRRIVEILDKLHTEQSLLVRQRNSFLSADQSGLFLRQSGSHDVPRTATLDQREHSISSEDHQELVRRLADLVRQSKENAQQTSTLVSRLTEIQTNSGLSDKQSEMPVLELLNEFQVYNAKQREIYDTLSNFLRKANARDDGNRGEKDGSIDRKPISQSSRALESLTNELATEAREVMRDLTKLSEERSNIKSELGMLMMMKSKYNRGGEFDPDWKPPASRQRPLPLGPSLDRYLNTESRSVPANVATASKIDAIKRPIPIVKTPSREPDLSSKDKFKMDHRSPESIPRWFPSSLDSVTMETRSKSLPID